MNDFLLSLAQIVIGAIVGSLGTIGVQKYLKRDENKEKEEDRARRASEIYRAAFVEEVSAIEIDDILNNPEQIARRALTKHRSAVTQFKPYLTTEEAEELESQWFMYSRLFEWTGKDIFLTKHDWLEPLQKLMSYADLPLKKTKKSSNHRLQAIARL